MLQRIDAEERNATLSSALGLGRTEPVVPAIGEADFDAPNLPHDHPQWVKDALSVSQRAREVIARLQPVVLRILTFWDHRVRSMSLGRERLSIDASGSYRLE